MPWVFVLIWSTGFIVARFGMPHAPPMKFLAVRYLLSAIAFGLWAAWSKATWPKDGRQWRHLAVVGVLMQAGYLGGVWSAVKMGMGAGLVALLVGLQPVLTAMWLTARGGRIHKFQWGGLLLGFLGLALVVWHKLDLGEIQYANVGLASMALASITIGTMYQKHYVAPCDVRTAGWVQMLAALVVTVPLALVEPDGLDWHPQLVGALAWSVLVLTLGGSSLLFLLIQRGAATEVTSLMYLVPPCTAIMAWYLFAEAITPVTLAGTVITAMGVAMVVRRK